MRRKTFLRIFAVAFSSLTTLSADESSMDWQECVEGVQNISARLRPCSRDFESFADLIVWTAREAGADCWAEVLTSANNVSSNDLRTVHFRWDPGFRVGIGYGMDHDQWDTKGYYTWFQTRGKDHVSSGFGTVHSAFLGNFYVDNQSGKGLSGPSYSQASIQWKIRYNIFDWELGRNFWVSESLTLRPFLGAKGGWIHQSIRTKWQN
ncbi:MAG TPA: Lpg1974 family pore-forming outer membrane protein, partial [Chlamydiales bacterium]|nr:Lpg1974 family pore-forming outer membrane protein [Chlamydiales bacterium]